MADLKVRHLVVGAVATNCYIAENRKTKEALIIDPGDNAARIEQIIKEDGVVPVAVLLTHGHFDHAMAAQEVAEQYGIKIYAHETEKETLETPQINLSGMIGRTLTFHADCYVKDGEILNLAGFEDPGAAYTGTYPGWCLLLYRRGKGVVFRRYTVLSVRWQNGFPNRKVLDTDPLHSG